MRNRNLIGQQFFDLTVIEKANPVVRPSGNKSAWLCECVCGNKVVVTQNNLISGRTKSCGCRNKKNGANKIVDLVGKRFGKLVVLEFDHERKTPNGSTKRYWRCKCDCGNEKIIQGSALTNGYALSCGCLRSESISKRNTRNLTGQTFGLLTVIKRADGSRLKGRHVVWECRCECGKTKNVASDMLISGHTSSCGCLGASTGEYWIAKILDKFHVRYEREYSFSDLVGPNNGLLRFDFAIFDTNNSLLGLIEYQGEQHYEAKSNGFGELQRETTDDMKQNYCRDHSIALIEIAYSDQLISSLRKALITLHANPVPRLGNE